MRSRGTGPRATVTGRFLHDGEGNPLGCACGIRGPPRYGNGPRPMLVMPLIGAAAGFGCATAAVSFDALCVRLVATSSGAEVACGMPFGGCSVAAPVGMPCTTGCPVCVSAGCDSVVYAGPCACPAISAQDGSRWCDDGFVIVIIVIIGFVGVIVIVIRVLCW